MLDTKDPYLLLSIVNTKLRDEADTLEELCLTYNKNKEELIAQLQTIAYQYNSRTNQFVGTGTF